MFPAYFRQGCVFVDSRGNAFLCKQSYGREYPEQSRADMFVRAPGTEIEELAAAKLFSKSYFVNDPDPVTSSGHRLSAHISEFNMWVKQSASAGGPVSMIGEKKVKTEEESSTYRLPAYNCY